MREEEEEKEKQSKHGSSFKCFFFFVEFVELAQGTHAIFIHSHADNSKKKPLP